MNHGIAEASMPLRLDSDVDEGLTAVICGSFRRDPDALKLDFQRLQEAGCAVLSPLDVNFVEEESGFVLAAHERGSAPNTVEAMHLRAMEKADFIWLHAPDGYLGRSAAMELGFAHALGLRVLSETPPDDIPLAGLVDLVESPAAAVILVKGDAGEPPARSIVALQHYYARMARTRGWAEESAEETLLLLTEEVGELARELRKERAAGRTKGGEDASLELADVQLYVLHMANVLGIDLGTAVVAKERVNEQRFRDRQSLAA